MMAMTWPASQACGASPRPCRQRLQARLAQLLTAVFKAPKHGWRL